MSIIAYPRLKRELTQDEIDKDEAIKSRGQELYQRLGVLADKKQETLSPREGGKGWLNKVWTEKARGDFAAKTEGILIAADIVELDETGGHKYVIDEGSHTILGLDINGHLIPSPLNYFLEAAQREEIMDRIASTADELEAKTVINAGTSLSPN